MSNHPTILERRCFETDLTFIQAEYVFWSPQGIFLCAYGRHQLSRPMRIEAPITKTYVSTKNLGKNGSPFLKLCHHRPILGIGSLTRSLHDTRKWEFWISRVNVNFFQEKTEPLFLWKIWSSQAKVRNTFFDQRSPQPPELGVSDFWCKCKLL